MSYDIYSLICGVVYDMKYKNNKSRSLLLRFIIGSTHYKLSQSMAHLMFIDWHLGFLVLLLKRDGYIQPLYNN